MKFGTNSFFSRLLSYNIIIVFITLLSISLVFGYLIQNYYYGLREWKTTNNGHRISEVVNEYIEGENLQRINKEESKKRLNTISNTTGMEIGIINNEGQYILNSSNFESFNLEIENKSIKEVMSGNQVTRKIKGPEKNHLLMIFPLFKDPLKTADDVTIDTGDKKRLEVIGGIVLETKLDDITTTLFDILKLILYASIVGLIIAVSFSIKFSKNIVKPINNLQNAAQNISNGKYTKVKENSINTEEIKNLVNTYNYAVEEIKNNIEKKKRLEKMRKEYIADISHEFRSPLASINGFIEIITEEELDEEKLQKYSKIIKREADYLNYLVEELLLLGQLDSEGYTITKEKTKLNKLIEFAVDSKRKEIKEKSLNIKIDLENEEININVDPNKFREVFLNLIENAVKYSPQGKTIKISSTHHYDENNNLKEIKIIISDQGKGIPEDKKEKIWQRFYKLDAARTRDDKKSSGLGLSIVKEIIENHEAEIEVENNKESGPSFIITLKEENLL
ncbi:MAG TPA: HAMP domain-containing sensor histidine kinase [Halanaerobiales bacterium]|nr:HAMP domain-containing sensor histidine kinase [Halanaerobiales bacterium]